jgi:hypothetical protein
LGGRGNKIKIDRKHKTEISVKGSVQNLHHNSNNSSAAAGNRASRFAEGLRGAGSGLMLAAS